MANLKDIASTLALLGSVSFIVSKDELDKCDECDGTGWGPERSGTQHGGASEMIAGPCPRGCPPKDDEDFTGIMDGPEMMGLDRKQTMTERFDRWYEDYKVTSPQATEIMTRDQFAKRIGDLP